MGVKKSGTLFKGLILVWVLTTLGACGETGEGVKAPAAETGRWYRQSQVDAGKVVYEQHCQSCHNPGARGTFQWKKPLEDGSYPPPPLNGSAHAWHHPLPALLSTIENGGVAFGGKMPPFKEVLSRDDQLTVIAYFQHFWSDEIYQQWLIRNQAR